MNLVFYSGEHIKELNDYIINSIGKKLPTLTIIPSSSIWEKSESFKNKIIHEFESYWFKVIYYPVDRWVFEENIYLESDIIYLSWWNTQKFLDNLKSNWDLESLKKFASGQNKILCWLSAWAILMTNSIKIDNYSQWEWLWLVDFDFYPHYWDGALDDNFLNNYCLYMKNKIYAVPNNSGIIVNEDWVQLIWLWIKEFN